jgi:hypothetical protein
MADYRSQSDALVAFGPPSGQAVTAVPLLSGAGGLVLVGALIAAVRLARPGSGVPRVRSRSR